MRGDAGVGDKVSGIVGWVTETKPSAGHVAGDSGRGRRGEDRV